jgi:segregation and condensation protein A
LDNFVLETQYVIQLPVYEGPLDLLLDLIRKAELDITKVALAQITDQYLEYLSQATQHDLSDLSSFLIIAAQLLQIKSEALLPRPPEREPGEEDPGEELARQLIAYKKYKQVAELLSAREKAGLKTYLRISARPRAHQVLDEEEYQVQDLLQAYLETLATQPRPIPLGDVVLPPVVKILDRIRIIVDELRFKGRTSFRYLLSSAKSRLEIVVSFLAVLELVKQRQVHVHQSERFGEIEILPGTEWEEDQRLDLDLEFDE